MQETKKPMSTAKIVVKKTTQHPQQLKFQIQVEQQLKLLDCNKNQSFLANTVIFCTLSRKYNTHKMQKQNKNRLTAKFVGMKFSYIHRQQLKFQIQVEQQLESLDCKRNRSILANTVVFCKLSRKKNTHKMQKKTQANS